MLEIIKKVYKEKKLSLLIIEKIIFIVYIFFNYINIANNSRTLMITKLNKIEMVKRYMPSGVLLPRIYLKAKSLL